MNVAGSREEVTKNALDHSGHFACPLAPWFGHIVHDGRIHSRSPGHRDRGGTDEFHSGTKGPVAALKCISAAGIPQCGSSFSARKTHRKSSMPAWPRAPWDI